MSDPYAPARVVTDVAGCRFYHAMEVPGHGVMPGDWDLRGRVDQYLGGVSLRGRRVLEVGTASGFLCFEMERRGADVVALDLDATLPVDIVPFAGDDQAAFRAEMAGIVAGGNDAWWLCHRAFGSRARLVHAPADRVPAAIGPVDVATFGCVLLHIRDPFAALASALRLTRETAVVSEFLGPRMRLGPRVLRERNPFALAQVLGRLRLPVGVFMPDHRAFAPKAGWWLMTPALMRRFLAALGFDAVRETHHTHRYEGQRQRLYTVVAERRRGAVEG